jgi:phospholipid N-methyltransferase
VRFSPVTHMVRFWRNMISHFHHTGAVAPSSAWLAQALASPLAKRPDGGGPMRILEAGPGTGALTVAIVRRLLPGDHLTLCEINEDFVGHLNDRFTHDPLLAPWREQTTIHHGPIQDLPPSEKFHHIVCGLPFNNFPPELVQAIFDGFETHVTPNGTVNYFEYAMIRRLKSPFVNKPERTRLRQVEQVLTAVAHRRKPRRKLVLLNMPPAWAWHLE